MLLLSLSFYSFDVCVNACLNRFRVGLIRARVCLFFSLTVVASNHFRFHRLSAHPASMHLELSSRRLCPLGFDATSRSNHLQ
jgi:hypothetical protein